MNQQITPVIDMTLLQEKANEYAKKGAEKALEDFYTGYDSPYKKAIRENLENKALDHSFNIPDIIGVLNEKFSQEIDLIANTAVAKSFVPMLKEILIREDAEVKFSDILKKFIEVTDFNREDFDEGDYTCERIERGSTESLRKTFFHYQISNGSVGYELHFYEGVESTTIMSLPYMKDEKGRFLVDQHYIQKKEVMKISLDGGATLEMPFTRGVLDDPFISYVARLVIGNCNIIFDVDDFNEEMFPENECHC